MLEYDPETDTVKEVLDSTQDAGSGGGGGGGNNYAENPELMYADRYRPDTKPAGAPPSLDYGANPELVYADALKDYGGFTPASPSAPPSEIPGGGGVNAPNEGDRPPSWYGGDYAHFKTDILNSLVAPDPILYPDLNREWLKQHGGDPSYHDPNGWFLGPNGEKIPVQGTPTPVYNAKGEVQGYTWTSKPGNIPPESAYHPTPPQSMYGVNVGVGGGVDYGANPELVYANAFKNYGMFSPSTPRLPPPSSYSGFTPAVPGSRSQAEDYALRHPGFSGYSLFNPSRPEWQRPTLTPPVGLATNQSLSSSTVIGDTLSIPTPVGPGGYIGYPAKLFSPGYVPPWQVSSPPSLGPTRVIKFEDQWYDPSTGKFIQHEHSPLWQVIDDLATGHRTAQQAIGEFLTSTYGTGRVPFSPLSDAIDAQAGRILHTNFLGLGASRGDVGFRPEFKDDYLYGSIWGKPTPESKQLGHFGTAIAMGLDGSAFSKREVIGHEQYGDYNPPSYLGGVPLPFSFVGDDDIAAFDKALAYDLQGNPFARDYWLATILDENRFGPQSRRQGNSMEDLRLSAKGWELGRDIATGRLRTNGEVADWIIRNVADWWLY